MPLTKLKNKFLIIGIKQSIDQPLQCAIQKNNPRVGAEAFIDHRDHRELDDRAKLVDLLGGRVCRRRYCQTVATSKVFF